MNEEDVKRILREELAELIKSDRFVFFKPIQMLDGRDIQLGLTNGTKLGKSASEKLGVWGATPIVQPTTSVAGADFSDPTPGTVVTLNSRFDGYTLQQLIKALRNEGLLA